MLVRSVIRPCRRSIVSCTPLYKNTPRFDDAELMASKLNNAAYTAKRSKEDYQWAEKSAQEVENEHNDRMARMMKISAALRGLFVVAGLGAAYTLYMQWPQIKGWWLATGSKLDDNAIEVLKKRKEKKRQMEFPTIPADEPGSSVPGLYYWGYGRNDGKNSKFPLRVPQFDGEKLSDVFLSAENGNLAINDRGDLYLWDTASRKLILGDQNLVSVKGSNGVAYALNKKGELLVIPVADDIERSRFVKTMRSWLLPWRTYCKYERKLDTTQIFTNRGENKVVQFDVGKDHLVFISNAGKAYTCATGVKRSPGIKSKGQFGVPTLSQFDPFPECNKVYEIELLNHGVSDSGNASKKIEKIACGNYHTLALDSLGELFSFGVNTHGQLGQPISYDMEYIPFPKKVTNFSGHFSRDTYLRVVDINAGGDTSFATVLPQDVHKYFKNKGNVALEEDIDKITYFAFGSGISGELGNGHFKHSQQEPTKLKVVNDITDGASTVLPRSSKIAHWACGKEHVFCQLENNEVVTWGSNSEGQLGNGKKIKSCRPINIPQLLEPGTVLKNGIEQNTAASNKLRLSPGQVLVAGDLSSCIYWKA
ncbi:LADA_0C12024g1_1 [Lachancea dasiensis]|uniref:LADA_0C12024g1_1 n=1 Tax=Lachancea dasiensis TaxID=1072105 RepID=A0A1G4J1U3_9SACH|nr:LADA_0C12024g1_1 [Lachancea dasiensis]